MLEPIGVPIPQLLEERYKKYRKLGVWSETLNRTVRGETAQKKSVRKPRKKSAE